jgi:hypothetical protein
LHNPKQFALIYRCTGRAVYSKGNPVRYTFRLGRVPGREIQDGLAEIGDLQWVSVTSRRLARDLEVSVECAGVPGPLEIGWCVARLKKCPVVYEAWVIDYAAARRAPPRVVGNNGFPATPIAQALFKRKGVAP